MTEFNHVTFYHGEKRVFEDFSHRFPVGKCTVVMGASGVGKTTLLRLLSGLETPQSGNVTVPQNISVMFQEPRLFPWLTVQANIEIVLNANRETASNIALDWLRKVRLESDKDAFPAQLSGGMQRRVALARALAPAVSDGLILLDEPFTGLDEVLMHEMQVLVAEAVRGKTAVIVTHAPTTAEMLGDELLLL